MTLILITKKSQKYTIYLKLQKFTKIYLFFLSQAFKTHGVVPDVLKIAPPGKVSIIYKNSGKEVNFGNELTPKQVKEIPEVNYEADEDAYYTLIMTDPDAPSRQNPKSREWQHWLVVNIPGHNVANGQTLSEYVGSGPPKNTGLHRYVFIVYKQNGKINFNEPHRSNTEGRTRGKFSAEKFAEKYNLGKPCAGNFFQAQYDDSVPALHKQLGF